MSTSFRPLDIRARLGRKLWRPPEPHGPDGWKFRTIEEPVFGYARRSVIVSRCDLEGVEWVHASVANTLAEDGVPTYGDLVLLHQAVWNGQGFAYQCFVPPTSHINIHPRALHLWGRLDGEPAMPDFGGILGSI